MVEAIAEPTIITEAQTPEAAAEPKESTLLGAEPSEAGAETPEAKAATEASNKALLEKDEATLTEEEKVKKAELVKVQASKTVPEKYEVKVEGMDINQPLLDALTPVFKKHSLTQEAVNELAQAYAPVIKSQIEAQSQKAIADWKAEIKQWKLDTIKELGADHAKETAYAARLINKFGGTKEDKLALRQLLEDTGVGNHKLLVKFMIQAGKAISEDSFVDPAKTSKGGKVDLYDHPTSQQ